MKLPNKNILDIDQETYASESETLDELIGVAGLSKDQLESISKQGAEIVSEIRNQSSPGFMEVFLSEYGLNSDEGVALMCLAEALLRVPDAETIDDLIEDKISPSDWGKHMNKSTSSLVNASTWALMLTGKVLKEQDPSPVGHLRSAIKRLGTPLIRQAVGQAMKEMGRQFVLGESIQSALKKAKKNQEKGYTYSYDMLGEAACTDNDAKQYHLSYSQAIEEIASHCEHKNIRENPGISVKLSALYPRFEVAQRERVLDILVPRVQSLASLAKSAGIGFTIDAEEADKLMLSMEIIEIVLSDESLAGWDGFGVVVQAYGQRAGEVIQWLYRLVTSLNRYITIRLVKGAYWDSEIKKAQLAGMSGFPVFTSKAATDISYIANAKRLFSMTDRIFPQFATHNAHTIAAILAMAPNRDSFEFQRLHGMGEQLHELILEQEKTQCRIYAPVGAHRDLLAYLVRRLLENGANSSFVNQVVDENVPAEVVAMDPFSQLDENSTTMLKSGINIFQPERKNSQGWDINHWPTLCSIDKLREQFRHHQWHATSILEADERLKGSYLDKFNPADKNDKVGIVKHALASDVEAAISAAQPWNVDIDKRREVLNKAADLLEKNHGEIFALLAREAGKTLTDSVSEIREAVDFVRYYAAQANNDEPVGTFTSISPWNFPLAIFIGQVSAVLAAGNAVLAKPAEQTPLIAWLAVRLMHQAGIPKNALQLLTGDGSVGAMLTCDARVDGVVFTGSTNTAKKIRLSMAENLSPGAPFIAETGGLNAMIVDSTALLEQAVQAAIESAFQSSGQRCSALRCLYVQDDIFEDFTEMFFGAMDELHIGNPWLLSSDLGPIIDKNARDRILHYIEKANTEKRILKQLQHPQKGHFIGPVVIKVEGIQVLEEEVFGPVLHLAKFKANGLDSVINHINDTGYGLTFGLLTRIDDRVQKVSERINAGNIYVNRNQIGAIVGSQPFGGNGLSGTGPKAGGPHYLERFSRKPSPYRSENDSDTIAFSAGELQKAIDNYETKNVSNSTKLPGVTGESNLLTTVPREPLLCFGPGEEACNDQVSLVENLGGNAIKCNMKDPEILLKTLNGYSGVIWWGNEEIARKIEMTLAEKPGALIPLITGKPDNGYVNHERHVCVDTTASGGNADLLAGSY